MSDYICAFDSQHEDMIHDAQLDYYSRKLATCSSDGTIKVFDVLSAVGNASPDTVSGGQNLAPQIPTNASPICTITSHTGPVWRIGWSHPKFGSLLASCSYDGTVLIHREGNSNQYSKVYTYASKNNSPILSLSWAPMEYGVVLAAASADGQIHIINPNQGELNASFLNVSSLGATSVSWAPADHLGHFKQEGNDNPQTVKRLVTGSCDNVVRIYKCQTSSGGSASQNQSSANTTWEMEIEFKEHNDWVRDVAWAPSTGMPFNMIASASDDGTVVIYTQDELSEDPQVDTWKKYRITNPGGTTVNDSQPPVCSVSWSLTGNILAISTADQRVTLWKQGLTDTEWIQVGKEE